MQRFPRGPSQGRARPRSPSRSPSRPRYFRRSPARSPSRLRPPPLHVQPQYFRPRSRSPPPAPAFHARSASQPRPPQFYRRSPSSYRQRSPPPPRASQSRFLERPSPPRASQPRFLKRSSPPRMPPRSHSQPRFRVSPRRSPPRSPVHAQSRSRSEWRKPPSSSSSSASSSFQRGKSLARDEFCAPAKKATYPADRPHHQWKAKPHASGKLAQRIITLDEFCAEVLDATGKLLPNSKRPRSPGMPIPVPLMPGEEAGQYEKQFRKWLVSRRNILVEDLRGDPGKERVFRFSYAYSRLPVNAWNNPKVSKNTNPSGEQGRSSDDASGGRSDSVSHTAAAMPPRARPYKRSRSIDPMSDDKADHDVEVTPTLTPESKRPRRASPRDPRIRVATSDTPGDGEKDPPTVATTTVEHDAGDDIDGIPISDVEAAQTCSSSSESAASSAIRMNGDAKEAAKREKVAATAVEAAMDSRLAAPVPISKPKTPPAKTPQSTCKTPEAAPATAIAVSKTGGDITESNSKSSSSDNSDGSMPKWATALLKRVQDLECEVHSLRRQLSAQQADATAKSIGGTDLIKVDRVDVSTDQQQRHSVHPEDRSATRGAYDPVKTRLAAAYNDLNDEILLNEKAVAESEQFVVAMMKTDECQARELQAQIQELSAAIELEKSKRDAALAALIAHCWKDRTAELEALLTSPLKASDTAAVQQASHAKCANLAAQVKLQGRALVESEKAAAELPADDDKNALRLGARVAEAARGRLERKQEAEYVVLLCASERVRSMVRSLLKAAP